MQKNYLKCWIWLESYMDDNVFALACWHEKFFLFDKYDLTYGWHKRRLTYVMVRLWAKQMKP